MTSTKAHWEHVYQTRDPGTVSWFQEHPTVSLELIDACGPTPST